MRVEDLLRCFQNASVSEPKGSEEEEREVRMVPLNLLLSSSFFFYRVLLAFLLSCSLLLSSSFFLLLLPHASFFFMLLLASLLSSSFLGLFPFTFRKIDDFLSHKNMRMQLSHKLHTHSELWSTPQKHLRRSRKEKQAVAFQTRCSLLYFHVTDVGNRRELLSVFAFLDCFCVDGDALAVVKTNTIGFENFFLARSTMHRDDAVELSKEVRALVTLKNPVAREKRMRKRAVNITFLFSSQYLSFFFFFSCAFLICSFFPVFLLFCFSCSSLPHFHSFTSLLIFPLAILLFSLHLLLLLFFPFIFSYLIFIGAGCPPAVILSSISGASESKNELQHREGASAPSIKNVQR